MVAATTANKSSEQHFLLNGVDWERYEALLRGVGDRHVFVTYDRGKVELMAPSWEHENRSETVGQLIRAVAEGLGLKLKSGGSATFHREDLDRGLEPDKCFYIQNEAVVRHKKAIDLSVDPPPDLCIEIEISQRLLDRADIYAALGVPELWRDNGKRLRVFTRSSRGQYVEVERGIAFPSISTHDLNDFLQNSLTTDELSWAADVRERTRRQKGA